MEDVVIPKSRANSFIDLTMEDVVIPKSRANKGK
jgi:hypothetical protein